MFHTHTTTVTIPGRRNTSVFRLTRTLTALTTLALASTTVSASGNLLPAPGDLSGNYYWEIAKTPVGTFDTDSDSATGLSVQSENDQGYVEWRVSPYLTVEPDSEYSFSLDVKAEGCTPHVSFYGYTADNQPRLLCLRNIEDAKDGWVRVQGTFYVPEGIEKVRFGWGITHQSGSASLRNPSLTQGRTSIHDFQSESIDEPAANENACVLPGHTPLCLPQEAFPTIKELRAS